MKFKHKKWRKNMRLDVTRGEHLRCLLMFVTGYLFLIMPVLAQETGWTTGATDLLQAVYSGMQIIGTGIVTIGFVVIGLGGAFTGEINWKRLAMVVVGGILITGAGTLAKLFEL